MADIAVSFAEVLPAQHPAVFGLPIEHVTALLGKPQNSMPVDLDLADPATHAALCSIDLDWPQIAAEQREEWLQNVRVSLPIRQIATGDIALLPGGIISARHPTTCLVCDPQQAVTLDDDAARQVRRVLAGRAGVATLINTEDGVTLRSVLPDLLPPQCASIVEIASNLPGSAAFAGPVVIQWFATGATMWPMLPAPPALALAASIAAAPLSEDASPTAAEFWDASDAETRQNSAGHQSGKLPVRVAASRAERRFAVRPDGPLRRRQRVPGERTGRNAGRGAGMFSRRPQTLPGRAGQFLEQRRGVAAPCEASAGHAGD